MLRLTVGDVKHGHEEVIVTPAVLSSWLEELLFYFGRQPSSRSSDPACPASDHESTLLPSSPLLRCQPHPLVTRCTLDRSQSRGGSLRVKSGTDELAI